MKMEQESTMTNSNLTQSESSEATSNATNSSSLLPRILSGSIGSIVTALTVTPLEVVKIRQQLSVTTDLVPSSSQRHQSPPTTHKTPACPRGCTVVLNNGLMECIVPKSSLFQSTSFARTYNSTNQTFLPRSNGGMFHTLISILHYEGLAGLYAGLRPTLVMSVPNTVLYFTVYDEISLVLRRNHWWQSYSSESLDSHQETTKSQIYIPFIAGSTARLLASLVTAPLELIRTRQASIVHDSTNNNAAIQPGMTQEFRQLVQTRGLSALYVGLAPTLWRDVPFSAIYWMCLERFKNELSTSQLLGRWGGLYYMERGEEVPARVEAMHAFLSGAMAGSIAAAFTTPFDVVKTRRQMVVRAEEGLNECNKSVAGKGPVNTLGIVGHMRQIVKQEGILGLWKGNTTRMVKVAPACAIMISVYEFGKRAFGNVII